MTCVKCGTELPENAKFCDNCGSRVDRKKAYYDVREQKDKQRALYFKIAILILIPVLASIAFVIGSISNGSANKSNNKSEITSLWDVKAEADAEKYNSLEYDMNYEQVLEIMGGQGALIYGAEEDPVVELAWPGKEWAEDYWREKPQILVGINPFTDKVVHIEEVNVLDWDTVKENCNKYPDRETTSFEKEDLDKIQEGVSYEEIVDMLGSEGMLVNSKSTKEGSTDKTFLWVYEELKEDGRRIYHSWEIGIKDGKTYY